ncbi:MAG: monovalent cation/H+ antiporter subunit D family protein, partial [Planctomycetes bacterium]|nr:monovalent cation/H+ antiporter subunit D family protein [Planctomycetota bacterium]
MNFFEQSPVLIIAFPLLAALVCGLVGLFNRRLCYPLAVLTMAFVFVGSLAVLWRVISEGVIRYHLGSWPPPIGIEYVVDHLNALVLFVIGFVGLLAVVYSKKPVEDELPDKRASFYTLYLLMITGLLGMTLTGDAFNLYVLLEISALTSYALIAAGKGRAKLSAFNYLILGTVGACFYLLGVGHLYIMTGTLNMFDLFSLLPALYNHDAIKVAFVFILIGVWVKMAFFPLHGWLPNAYTHAPSATSCVMAPLMTKVSVYIMIRIMFSVFSPTFTFDLFPLHGIITWLAVAAIVGGSLLALAQRDFKKMLTYLIVAEVGYMVGGVWLGNANG